MLKEITRHDVLAMLRKHDAWFSRHPNSQNVIILERQEWNEDAKQPESFDVEVHFTHPNYIYLLSELYGANKSMIRDGGFGIDIFRLLSRIKMLVKQLEDDGYLKLEMQGCSFHTEFCKEIVYEYPDGEPVDYPFERYINASTKFSKDELLALNTSILLTTKGQSRMLFIKERLFSEPVGTFSLLISLVALLASIF